MLLFALLCAVTVFSVSFLIFFFLGGGQGVDSFFVWIMFVVTTKNIF